LGIKKHRHAVFCAEACLAQDMKTAMKANRKISTPPAAGKTMGINGTMDSTTSVDSLCAGVEWFDMAITSESILVF
jgi:hypothetical protein